MPPLRLLLLLLLAAPLPWSVAAAAAARAVKLRAFPLRARQVPAGTLPRPPSKLRFHHNVSLTVSLAVGTPPQNVTMVLDTGSELSWLLCSAPAGRAPAPATKGNGASFRARSSSSFASVPCGSAQCSSRDLPAPPSCDAASRQCRVSLSYADGSTSDGALATDVFHVGSGATRSAFGCMSAAYDSSPDAVPTAGLLGMNRGALSFVSQAATRRFSYCISDRDDAGVLLLGHSDLPPGFLPLNYTPLYQPALPLPYFDRVAYSVQLLGIRVGGKLLPIPASVLAPDHTGAGQTMVNSGTQFTFLLGDAYSALKSEFLRQTRPVLPTLNDPSFAFQGAFDTCFRVPAGRAPPAGRLPVVTLLFKGAEMVVSGDRLLYRVSGERRGGDGVWCLTFGNADMVPLTAYVIGHHHQMNLWVEYDLERGRVGLASVKCDVASERLGLML
jgi:hypothetical protein